MFLFVASVGSIVVPQKKGKKRAESGSAGTSSDAALKDFTVEYAKSGRAACRGCEQKILKDEVCLTYSSHGDLLPYKLQML